MKPSKNAASSAWPSSGSTCATYWSGRTTTMQPSFAIDAAHREDVVAALEVGAEHLLVVAKSVASLRREQERRAWPRWRVRDAPCWNTARTSITESISAPAGVYFFDGRLADSALRKSHSARMGELAAAGSPAAGKDEDPPASVRLGDVAEMNRLGVREPDDRRGVKAHADRQTLGQMLVVGFGGEERRAVVRRGSRGIAAVPDEIVSGFRRRPRPCCLPLAEARIAAHSRSKSISSLATACRSAE